MSLMLIAHLCYWINGTADVFVLKRISYKTIQCCKRVWRLFKKYQDELNIFKHDQIIRKKNNWTFHLYIKEMPILWTVIFLHEDTIKYNIGQAKHTKQMKNVLFVAACY